MTAAASAASMQCAVRCRTTPRKLRSVARPGGGSLLYGSAFRNRCTAAGVRRRRMIRRSSAVNSANLGAEIIEQFVRRPAVPRIDRDEPSVRIDDGGAEVMHYRVGLTGNGRHPESRGEV